MNSNPNPGAAAAKPVSQITLSVYGYGMLSLSVAVAILLSNGFFTSTGSDLYFAWGIAIFAGSSGALAIAMVRTYFSRVSVGMALLLTGLFNVFLFGCYFTSYIGYSRLVVMYEAPALVDNAALTNFWHTLSTAWLSMVGAAFVCTLAYWVIQRFASHWQRTAAETDRIHNNPLS